MSEEPKQEQKEMFDEAPRPRSALSDHEAFLERQRPHESVEAINEAMTAFIEGVHELALKHRIAEALVVTRVHWKDRAGEMMTSVLSNTIGLEMSGEELAVWAYGHESAQRQRRHSKLIDKLVVQAGRKKK